MSGRAPRARVADLRIGLDVVDRMLAIDHLYNVRGISALVGECLRESSGGWLTASRGLRVMARQAREARRGSTLRPVVSATGRLPDLTPEQIAWLRKRIDGTHGCIQRAADEWHVSRDAIKRAIKRYEIGGTPSDDPDDP